MYNNYITILHFFQHWWSWYLITIFLFIFGGVSFRLFDPFCGEFLASWAASTTSPKEAKLSLIELRRRDLSAWTSSRWHFWFWQGQRKCQSPFCHLSWKPNNILNFWDAWRHLIIHWSYIVSLSISISIYLSLLRPQDSSPSKLHDDLSMMDGMRKQTLSGVSSADSFSPSLRMISMAHCEHSLDRTKGVLPFLPRSKSGQAQSVEEPISPSAV